MSDELDGWEPRPVPRTTPETEDYWAGCADGVLQLTECADCGLVYHYPRALCPDCFSDDTEWVEVEGTGEIYSFSIQEQMRGWPEEALPHVIAYVELDDGPRMMTNIVDCDPSDLAIGDRVEVRFVPTDEPDVAIPVFTPVEG
jgi:uncharacterized OB-fold protein